MSQNPIANPKRTAALVVGIEKYMAQDWDLDGVAAGARMFAEWLIGRKVPADRILLHLSEKSPAGPLQVMTKSELIEINVLDANHETIRKSFRETIATWSKWNELDLLIVYWAGHGYVDHQVRWLDYSDSRHEDRRAFPFDSLLAAARCWPYPALTAAFIDACASDLMWSEPEVRPGGEYFSLGTPNLEARQFVLFSARVDQSVDNLRYDDPESFSATLFKALEVADAAWPPDLPGIVQRVKGRYEELRGNRRTSRIPVFANISWDGDVTDSGVFRLSHLRHNRFKLE